MLDYFIWGYIILVVLYAVNLYLQKDKQIVFKILVVAVAPGFGFLFLLITKLLSVSEHSRPEVENSDDEISKKSSGSAIVTSSDNLIAKDILSLSDILHHNDVDTKRKRFFKEISGDINKTSYFLKKALKDEDSEIAHYAAALITGSKQKLITEFGVAKEVLKSQQRKEKDLVLYMDTLLGCINSGLFCENDVQNKRQELAYTFDEYFEISTGDNENYSYERINNEIFLGNNEKAYEICKEFLKSNRYSEKPYIALMKVLNAAGNRKRFYEIVNYVKSNNVVNSKEFCDIISFWEKVA